ncbi:hypothetical protein GWG67_34315 [Bradyrhizobium sp. CSS354]|nr:hypothetical protein [Bradyrhizobium sp. CSS354]
MRTVKIIVPFAAGSANDVSARFYADGLTRRWGKPVVVENRPGADAVVGGGAFANARDDHTLLYGTASMVTVSPLLQDSLPYDPSLDMLPIASTASSTWSSRFTTALRCARCRSWQNWPERSRVNCRGVRARACHTSFSRQCWRGTGSSRSTSLIGMPRPSRRILARDGSKFFPTPCCR